MKKLNTRRPRRSREEWQVLVANFNAADGDLQTYCDRAGITTNRFHIWQHRFQQSAFVELPVVDTTASMTDTLSDTHRWDIELILGHNIILRMRRP